MIGNKADFAMVWDGYGEYVQAVREAAPGSLNLRNSDRYLWGKSVAEQLQLDIRVNFARAVRSTLQAPTRPDTSSLDRPADKRG